MSRANGRGPDPPDRSTPSRGRGETVRDLQIRGKRRDLSFTDWVGSILLRLRAFAEDPEDGNLDRGLYEELLRLLFVLVNDRYRSLPEEEKENISATISGNLILRLQRGKTDLPPDGKAWITYLRSAVRYEAAGFFRSARPQPMDPELLEQESLIALFSGELDYGDPARSASRPPRNDTGDPELYLDRVHSLKEIVDSLARDLSSHPATSRRGPYLIYPLIVSSLARTQLLFEGLPERKRLFFQLLTDRLDLVLGRSSASV